eukprot:gene50842-68058_t
MSMRHFGHATFVMSMPVDSEERKGLNNVAAHHVRLAGMLYSWGLRLFLMAAPMVSGIVHAFAMPVVTVLLLVALFFFDRPAETYRSQRRIGAFTVSSIGLGCMNLSHAYGVPPSFETAERLLLRALDLGCTFFDTAALYGFGANEELVGRVLAPHRQRFTLASKCGLTGVDGKRVVDGRPATLKKTCEDALLRLRTEVIDLYYLHRQDPKVPIEDSVGALADLVREGKIQAVGLSEVSSETLRRAHAVHPIAALQTEYSLWSRNAEIAVLAACREQGTAFVAFSPLG